MLSPLASSNLLLPRSAGPRQATTSAPGFKPEIRETLELSGVGGVAASRESAPVSTFAYTGLTGAGFYQQLRDAQGGLVTATREAELVDVGGFYVEGDPVYKYRGTVNGVAVDLQVKTQSQTTDLGGIHVVTNEVQHVTGSVAGRDYRATITCESEVSDVSGIPVQTGRRYLLDDGRSPLSTRSVSEVSYVGGLAVESDRYTLAESSAGKAVVRGLEGAQRQVTVEGDLPAEQVALLTVLRPFLA